MRVQTLGQGFGLRGFLGFALKSRRTPVLQPAVVFPVLHLRDKLCAVSELPRLMENSGFEYVAAWPDKGVDACETQASVPTRTVCDMT